jgi:serine/threonine-protein kinase
MARELFEREARTLGRVGNHPQIPRLLDYFEDRQQFYLIQEFVKGNNLQQEVKKNGVLNEAQTRQVLKEVVTILRDIHIQKVIHRDIKPANIIRREIDDRLVLIDFGVVKNQVDSVVSNETALTAFAVGTPGFAPPEQLAMRPVYASDVYALGVTCMYLMSGKAPKNMECDPITGDINWFKYVNVSDGFAKILTKMLEVAVKSRYKTAQEVLDVLDLEHHGDSLAESMLSPTAIDSNISTNRTKIGLTHRNSSRVSDQTANRAASKNAASKYRSSARTTRYRNTVGQTTSLDQAAKVPAKPIKISAEEILSAYDAGRKDFGLKDLSMQDLQKANLAGSRFYDSKLVRVNFQGADLNRSNFNNCDLRLSMFRNADLNKCLFHSSNLEGIDLRSANLSGANFKNTKLKGANLCGTNLSETNLTKEQLEETKTNWMTIMPSGKRGFW